MQKIKNVLLVLACLLAPSMSKAQFTSGSGTDTDPWIITTAQQLDNLRNYLGEEHRDKHFKLGSDIDLTAYIAQNYSEYGWVPIGQTEKPFYCYMDGDNHSITGLWITRIDLQNVGLFGYAGKLENIRVATDDDKGGISSARSIGCLAGYCADVINCHASGVVSNTSGLLGNIGGLVGWGKNVANSSSSCNVLVETNTVNAGGLAGYIIETITNSHATGDVTVFGSGGKTGGLAGNGNGIYNCYATGAVAVTGGNSSAGGLAGVGTSCRQCYATGNVEATTAGGLIGLGSRVINCYATGNVEATTGGGLIGRLGREVSSSYATGNVIALFAGGLVGEVRECYSQNSYFLQRDELKGYGLNSGSSHQNIKALADIVHAASFDGFDFDNIWAIDEGRTSPYLRNMGDYRPVNNEPVESISDGSIWSAGGNLYVRASQPTTLSVYSIVGVQLYRQNISAGETSIALPQGIYIAKLGNQTQKVVVR